MTGPEGTPARRRGELAKGLAVLAAVFALGGVAGLAVGRTMALREMRHMIDGPPPEARARFRLEAMRRHLRLTDAQTEQVRAILAEADSERDRLMETCGPGLDDLRKRTDARVREVLDEEQRKRFDEGPSRHGRPRGPRPPLPPPP
ncbi:MAG: hypothetical protein R3F14_39240 [Polyangiaceae bacterium]